MGVLAGVGVLLMEEREGKGPPGSGIPATMGMGGVGTLGKPALRASFNSLCAAARRSLRFIMGFIMTGPFVFGRRNGKAR
jgi:hypothetical protein